MDLIGICDQNSVYVCVFEGEIQLEVALMTVMLPRFLI